jgi:hypothetical protein
MWMAFKEFLVCDEFEATTRARCGGSRSGQQAMHGGGNRRFDAAMKLEKST